MYLPTKQEALKLIEKHIKDKYQTLHSKMVAEVMQEYAVRNKKDINLYYVTGLLHDLDYYEFPKEHPANELKWFTDWEYPAELIQAVKAHATHITGVVPTSNLDKILFVVDELSGLLYAYSLMRPEKFKGMNAKGIKKKIKDKRFAPNISREDIKQAFELVDHTPEEIIELMVDVFAKMPEFN